MKTELWAIVKRDATSIADLWGPRGELILMPTLERAEATLKTHFNKDQAERNVVIPVQVEFELPEKGKEVCYDRR